VSYNFLVDANLPNRLVNFLREQGLVAYHIGRMQLPTDEAVWAKAIELDAIVISQDADFLTLMDKNPQARLVLDSRGNRLFLQIMEDYREALPSILEGLNNGERLIELS
jgi:predicted nuclease of predicted toxin-antitoxin system